MTHKDGTLYEKNKFLHPDQFHFLSAMQSYGFDE